MIVKVGNGRLTMTDTERFDQLAKDMIRHYAGFEMAYMLCARSAFDLADSEISRYYKNVLAALDRLRPTFGD